MRNLVNDMPHAREWADDFEEGIQKYGISADQIQRYQDADYRTMNSVFVKTYKKIKKNAK